VVASEVVVFAAGSLTDAFTEISLQFEAWNPGIRVRLRFASTDQLRESLQRGERADVLASANVAELERARDAGLLAGPIRVFAQNRLQVIVARNSEAPITSVFDLARPGLRLATEHGGAPLSGYTRAFVARATTGPFGEAGFADGFNQNVVRTVATVRDLVATVADGYADAAIVYVTDVTPEVHARLRLVEIPEYLNVTADYAISVVGEIARAGDLAHAEAFVSLVCSEAGQLILDRWGFQIPAELSEEEQETAP
jgi:molybdate transport system substrate-binding protein